MTALTAARVSEIFEDCDGGTTPVEGIRVEHFRADRVEAHRAEIAAMLDELPEAFRADNDGGMSFLTACMDRNGRQWCDSQATVAMLVALGVATGMLSFAAPREAWPILPGGMPYLIVDTAGAATQDPPEPPVTINLRIETGRNGWQETAARLEQALTRDPAVTWWSSAYGPAVIPHTNPDTGSDGPVGLLRSRLRTAAGDGDATDDHERGRQQGLTEALALLDATLDG